MIRLRLRQPVPGLILHEYVARWYVFMHCERSGTHGVYSGTFRIFARTRRFIARRHIRISYETHSRACERATRENNFTARPGRAVIALVIIVAPLDLVPRVFPKDPPPFASSRTARK